MSILKITKLVKRFESPEGGFQTVLDVPSFKMDPGEQVALSGESGSGKSTFLNLVAGILKPDSGSIELDGLDIASMDETGRDAHRAATLGYVFQSFNLLQGLTALENVELALRLGGKQDLGRAKALLGRMGLRDRLNYRPRQLSLGQQQRVAMARALAKTPPLVLADEPTGHLDPFRAQEAMDLLREVCHEQKTALLLVSHDPSILRLFKRSEKLEHLNKAVQPAQAQGGAK